MAGYTYATYVTALRTLVVSTSPDTDFDAILPSVIDYAEQRIYRELDLISTVFVPTPVTLAPGVRSVAIPNTIVAINDVAILTPAGTTSTTGVRQVLTPVSRAVVDMLYPGNTYVAAPKMFAMQDQWTVILGPSPDAAYALEIVATTRPAALSASNTSTFISERLPDLFIAASMVFMSGYMRNFGAQQSDSAMSASWEAQYVALKGSADTEEQRKYFNAASWSSQPVRSEAQPQRG